MSQEDSKKEIQEFIQCPHCELLMEINQLNCCIFRHGVFKNTMKHIPPHLSKMDCEKLVQEDLIYGCGKPFRIIIDNGKITAIICDYI